MARIRRQYRARGVWGKRFTVWVGHNEPWLWPSLFIGSALLGAWGVAQSVLIPVALVACWYLNSRGLRHLVLRHCPQCDAALPANPITGATKHARALRVHHLIASWGWTLYLVSVAAVFTPWLPVSAAGVVTLAAFSSGGAYAGLRHKQFHPWCPQCYPDGGGGPVGRVPSAPPLPVGTKPRELVTR